MMKEADYEAFLAEKIRLGKAALTAGQVVSKEEINAKMETLFTRLAQEQRLRELQENADMAIYG